MIIDKECKSATTLTEKAGMASIYAINNYEGFNKITFSILVRESEKELIFSFSGTLNPLQLINEAMESYPVSYDIHPDVEGKVSKYFYSHYLEFREDFLRELESYERTYQGYTMIFAGHSLGGALAVQAAADVVLSNLAQRNKVYVYTYGQPRVAEKSWLDSFGDQVDGWYRIVHWQDTVPHVPSCVPNLGSNTCAESGLLPFYPIHHSQEIFYDKDFAKYTECSTETGEDQECSNSIIHLSVPDHNNYFGIPVNTLNAIDDFNNDEVFKSLKHTIKVSS